MISILGILAIALVIALTVVGYFFLLELDRSEINCEDYDHYLADGPLLTASERKRMVTEAMAAELLETSIVPERDDAVRMLRTAGYSTFDVHLMVDDARAVAFQEIVAREMSHG